MYRLINVTIFMLVLALPSTAYARIGGGGGRIGGGQLFPGWREQSSQDLVRARVIITNDGVIQNNDDGSITLNPASSDLVINKFVPYTGAIKDVDLGDKNITTTGSATADVVDTQFIDNSLGGAVTVRDDLTVTGLLRTEGDIIYHGTSFILDGMSEQRQDIFLTTSAGNVFFEMERIGGGDIEYIFDEEDFILDCTTGAGTGGRAQVQLTEGTSTTLSRNFIFVRLVGGVATLQASTAIPSGEFAWVALVAILTDTEVDADGALVIQRFSETLKHDEDTGLDRGALSYQREKLRWLGAKYINDGGIAQSLTISVNGGASDNVILTTALGKVFQLHRQDWPAYDISSDGIWVANASGAGVLTNYQKLTDLNQAFEIADGTPISNNQRFNLVVWGSINFSTGDCKLFVNLSTGTYLNDNQTIADVNNTAVTTIPAEFETTGFLVARIPLKFTNASGGTWTNLMGGTSVINLLGLPTGFNLGSGATVGASASFSDDNFTIFDETDSTKQLMFQLSDMTNSTTTTLGIGDDKLGIGTTTPSSVLHLVDGSLPIITFGVNGILETVGSFIVNLDSDNNLTTQTFTVAHNATGTGGTVLFKVTEESADRASFEDGSITNVDDIALDTISSDGASIVLGQGDENTYTQTGGSTHAFTLGGDAGDDFTIDGTGFVYEGDNNRVGINEASPDTQLHGTSVGDVIWKLEADTDNSGENDNPTILFSQDDTGVRGQIGINGEAGATFTNSLVNASYFGDFSGQAVQFVQDSVARMTIKLGGRVGIGVTDPEAGLHIKGAGFPDSFIFIEANSGQDAAIRFRELGVTDWNIFNDAAGAGTADTFSIAFGNSVTRAFVIDNTGKVGIGNIGLSAVHSPLEVLSTTDPQIRGSHTDGVDDFTLGVDANGDLTILASGGDISFGDENISTTGSITGGSLVIDSNTIDLSDVTEDFVLTFNAATNTWAGEAGGGAGFDATAEDDVTWSDSGQATITHTFTNTGTNTSVAYSSGLATFSHDIQVSGNDIKDSGGITRIKLGGTPDVEIDDTLRVARIGIFGNPSATARILMGTNETLTSNWEGIKIAPTLTFQAGATNATAISGLLGIFGLADATDQTVFGLKFEVNPVAVGVTSTFSEAVAVDVVMRAIDVLSSGDTIVDEGIAYRGMISTRFLSGGTSATITDGYGLKILEPTHVLGGVITNYFGIAVEDYTVGSPTKNYLLEIGGTIGTTPYFRVIGDWTATDNETAIYILADDPVTLHHVTLGANDSGDAGFRVLQVPNL